MGAERGSFENQICEVTREPKGTFSTTPAVTTWRSCALAKSVGKIPKEMGYELSRG